MILRWENPVTCVNENFFKFEDVQNNCWCANNSGTSWSPNLPFSATRAVTVELLRGFLSAKGPSLCRSTAGKPHFSSRKSNNSPHPSAKRLSTGIDDLAIIPNKYVCEREPYFVNPFSLSPRIPSLRSWWCEMVCQDSLRRWRCDCFISTPLEAVGMSDIRTFKL